MHERQNTPLAWPSCLSWSAFTAAPHRMLFLPGAAQAILVMLLWSIELAGRYSTLVPTLPAQFPMAWGHASLMLYGLFPFFVFGFLFTVYPRWMNVLAVPRGHYLAVFALLSGGMLLFYTGLLVARLVALTGLALFLAGWVMALAVLIGVYRRAHRRGSHEQLLNFALAAGAVGLGLWLYTFATHDGSAARLATIVGLWLFLLPVVFTVSHRMIPFFGNAALPDYPLERPAWSLPLFAAAVAGHAACEVLDMRTWLFIFDLPLALLGLHHSLLWNLRRALSVRLLAMLHIAFLWFGIGMTLYAAQSLILLAVGEDVLGRAPLHALGIGFIAGMMVAMATRVTLGHSGRPLVADTFTWLCFLGINAAAVVRVAAELWPGTAGQTMNILAAAIWLLALLPWVTRYAPMYLRPRADGRPG